MHMSDDARLPILGELFRQRIEEPILAQSAAWATALDAQGKLHVKDAKLAAGQLFGVIKSTCCGRPWSVATSRSRLTRSTR